MLKKKPLNIRDLTRIANFSVLKDIPIPSITNNQHTLYIVRCLEDHLVKLKSKKELLLPDLVRDNESIVVFSDYGGESPDSRYFTYSFLFVAYSDVAMWSEESKKLRKLHKLEEPRKEIAFKDLNYGPVKRCLDDWLGLTDYIRGLLFTLVVSKKVMSATGRQDKDVLKEISEALLAKDFGKWKPKISEKLVRILHTLCYWISILSADGQKLFWMTDDDAIAANAEKLDSLGELFASVLSIYTDNKYAHLGYAKPFADVSGDLSLNDLLSIPDLAAGSLESLFTQKASSIDPDVKEGTNKVLKWLSYQGIGLKKHTMLVDFRDGANYHTAMLDFEVINETRDIEYVPIWL